MTPQLRTAIDGAYRVFSAYRIGPKLDFGSRVSVSQAGHDAMVRVLTGTPLRSLPAEAVDAYLEYIAAAHDDGGYNAGELRYFLPRALELIALGGDGTTFLRHHLEQILERGTARTAWPAPEIAAIDGVLASPTKP